MATQPQVIRTSQQTRIIAPHSMVAAASMHPVQHHHLHQQQQQPQRVVPISNHLQLQQQQQHQQQQLYYSHPAPMSHRPTQHPSQYYRFPVQHHQYPGSQMSSVNQHQQQQQQQQQQHNIYQRNGAYIPHPSSQWSRSSNSSPYNMMQPLSQQQQQQHHQQQQHQQQQQQQQQQSHMNNGRLPMRQNGPSWDDVVGMPMASMYSTGGHPVGSGGAGVRMMGPPHQPPPQPPPQASMNRMLIRERPPSSSFQGHRREDVVSIHPSTSGHVVMQPGSTMAAPAVKPLTVQTSHSGGAQSSGGTQNTAAQMSPNTAKKKCKNFLATLIRLASDQPEQTATNVKALIQGLIDGNIPPEDFTTQLQRELNSSPQPCLVPFLKKSLPHLRQSLMTKELSIDGVRPPPPGSLSIGQPGVPQAIIRSAPPTTVRLLHPTRMVTVTPSPRAILNTGHMISTGMTKSIVVQAPTPNKPMKDIVAKPPVQQKPSGAAPKQPQVIRNVVTAGPNEKVRYGSALREDDDINDVAAMGGVNLQEESQRILASNDIVGATRSCGDDVFLNSSALEKRIHIIAKKHGLDTVDSDVIKLMSHAVQEKLKGYIERLNIISEHRAEPPAFKAEPAKFEPTSDVRSQLRFLDELDKLEKKRHEEHERELLIRVAKSRSKVEDPEQQKLKQRAKEMQKAEMEEMRQREANMTALQAIGFRKKPRLDGGPGATGPGGTKVLRPRIKRVNMKDMLFMLESDKHWMRSNFIYKNYLK